MKEVTYMSYMKMERYDATEAIEKALCKEFGVERSEETWEIAEQLLEIKGMIESIKK